MRDPSGDAPRRPNGLPHATPIERNTPPPGYYQGRAGVEGMDDGAAAGGRGEANGVTGQANLPTRVASGRKGNDRRRLEDASKRRTGRDRIEPCVVEAMLCFHTATKYRALRRRTGKSRTAAAEKFARCFFFLNAGEFRCSLTNQDSFHRKVH